MSPAPYLNTCNNSYNFVAHTFYFVVQCSVFGMQSNLDRCSGLSMIVARDVIDR